MSQGRIMSNRFSIGSQRKTIGTTRRSHNVEKNEMTFIKSGSRDSVFIFRGSKDKKITH
jgi:hypothetical protein